MQFDLRTLIIAAAFLPPLATLPWWISDPKWNAHQASAAVAVASYSLAVLGLAGVYWKTRDWRRPPKKTPLLWTAMASSIIAAAAALSFLKTFPPPPPMSQEEQAQRQTRERAQIGERLMLP